MESDPEEFKEEFVEEPEGEEEGDGEEFDEEVEEEEVTNVPHSFFLDDLAMPRPCDHCDELMWGLTKQGYRCSVCDVTVHRRCINHTAKNCSRDSPKAQGGEQDPTSTTHRVHDTVSSAAQIVFEHRWKEADLKFTARCLACEELILLNGVLGFECTRCNNYVHEDCRVERGCIPRHADLIYVPEYDDLGARWSVAVHGDSLSDEVNERSSKRRKLSKGQQELTPDGVPIQGVRRERKPLLVFVNRRSGNQMGQILGDQFSQMLSPQQVFDLDLCGGPQEVLEQFKNVRGLRILVCGGDGSVGWVLGCIPKIAFPTPPPVAILPLGTGNDLARTMKWGKAYNDESLSLWLLHVEYAVPQKFDVWRLRTIPHKEKDSNGNPTKPLDILVNNYFSLGIDAKVVLDFHNFRKANPELASDQLVNKFLYALFGAMLMWHFPEKFEKIMTVKVDGKVVPLEPEFEGLMFMNIDNYAGGAHPWGAEKDSIFNDPSFSDNKLEICAVTGSWHMSNVCLDVMPASRFAQGRKIEISITGSEPVPFQVDGEPMVLEDCELLVDVSHQLTMLTKADTPPSSFFPNIVKIC